MGSVWSSGAAVPPTAHTCTLPTTHHDVRRTEDSRERGMGARGGVWTDGKAKRGNWKGRRAENPEQSYINSLHDRFTSLVLFQILGCSLAERMPLLMSSCSSSCTTAIKQNALFMKPFSQIHIAT